MAAVLPGHQGAPHTAAPNQIVASESDVEEGFNLAEAAMRSSEQHDVYGTSGVEAKSQRRSHRRLLAAGGLLVCAAIVAVAMLGADVDPPEIAFAIVPRIPAPSLAQKALLTQSLQAGADNEEGQEGQPLTLSPSVNPLEQKGAIDPDVGTDMDDHGKKGGLFPAPAVSASEDDGDADGDGDDEGSSPVTMGQQEARKEIALPGMAGGGLRYPLHAQDFYDHMLFNANLTLQTDKSWRYWSRIRVRDEVYYMLQKVKNLIIRNYDMHYNVKQDVASDRTFAKEDVELAQAKMTALVGEVKGVAEKVAAGLTNLRKSEEEEQRRLEQYKRHYDTDLRRIHAVLGNQTVELEKERHDSLRKAYDAELSKMQKNVDDILAEDRSQMVETEDEAKEKIQGIQTQLNTDVNDMSNLQSTILNNVGDVQKKEETDFNNVTSVHASIESYLKTMQQQLHESSLKQQSTDALAKSNEEQLTHVTTEVNSAAFKLSMLEKKQAEDHNEVNDKLQGLATSATGLESSLTTQTELIDKLKTTVDNFATENAAFKETVTGDHASLGATIANLQAELTKADVLKKDIQDLQTSMSTQINDLSSKIDDLGIKQSTLDTSVGHQKTDMAELQTRVAQLEVTSKAASDEAKSDHDQVSAVVEEMQAKLSVLLDLKDRVEQVEKSVQDNVASLQDKIALVDATHNSTRDTLLTSMQKLEAQLVEQANTEANADTSTTASIDEFKTELNDLNSFKSNSEKSAAELVKKLTDTTESLGIMNSKFEGQNTDLDSKISSLKESVNKVPTKIEFEKTLEDAMSKAKKAQGKLDEVGRDIEKIRQDQTTDDGRILTINGKVDEQNSNNNKNWQDVLDMIAQEGDLFAKISKKLKDDELRKDVDTVFGRTASASRR